MKKYILFIITASILFSSCKKDKTPEPQDEIVYKVKAETDVATGKTWTYDYDAQNRCIKEWKGNNQARREYTYSSSTIKEDEYSAAGNLDNTVIYDLNSEGLPFKKRYLAYPEYNTITFNNNKQKLKEIEYNASAVIIYTTDYYYTGQLLDSTIYKNAAGIITLKTVYQYYTDMKNTTTLNHRGISIYGKYSPMTIKSLTHNFYNYTTGAPQGTQAFTYTYEKDAQERIIKITTAGYSSGSVTYTYY